MASVAVMLPQANAKLTSVAPVGVSEDYDQAGGAGPAKWGGSVGAYLSEHSDRVAGNDTTSIVVTRQLIVPAELPVAWEQGDTVTYTYRGAPTTGQVRAVERNEVPGVAPATVRLTLEDA